MFADDAVNPQKESPEIYSAFIGVEQALGAQEFDAKLRHLVKLRASQINGCAFCVDMHLGEARKDGETQQRLDRVVVWRVVEDFNSAEKAALAWTELLTEPDQKADLKPYRDELRKHFSDKQISVLTATIAMINLWNRMQYSQH